MDFEHVDVHCEVPDPHKELNGVALFLLNCLFDPIDKVFDENDAVSSQFLDHGIFL